MRGASSSGPQKLELNGGQELVMTEQDIRSFLHPTLDELRKSIKLQNRNTAYDVSGAVYKAVVGYLGTIEMPKENQVRHNSHPDQAFFLAINFQMS